MPSEAIGAPSTEVMLEIDRESCQMRSLLPRGPPILAALYYIYTIIERVGAPGYARERADPIKGG
jgi:hypothetical protein